MVAGKNSGHPDLPPISIYGAAMRARSAGRITLRDSNPASPPLIDPRYLTDPDGYDQQVLLEASELITEMTHAKELAELLGSPAPSNNQNLGDRVVNYCHPVGTCKLGPADDPTTVVGPDATVHGIDHLYVADASLMPSITRGNINLPTAAIAARAACLLLDTEPEHLSHEISTHRDQADGPTVHERPIAT
jgi:choline dehydrogenase